MAKPSPKKVIAEKPALAAKAPASKPVTAATPAAKTPPKAAPKVASQAPAKPVNKAANTVKKPVEPVKTAPAAPSAASAAKLTKTTESKVEKAPKLKMERDSFTMPKAEYAQLAILKERLSGLGQPVKKSELLRAGIMHLSALNDAALKTALSLVPTIKTGRPKKK